MVTQALQNPRTSQHTGNLTLSPKFIALLAEFTPPPFGTGKRPTLKNGAGQKLRDCYVTESSKFFREKLSEMGKACYFGDFRKVDQCIKNGWDLQATETPYHWGYAMICIAGAQRVSLIGPGTPPNPAKCLRLLIKCGCPVDLPDTAGYTALHHSLATGAASVSHLAKTLVEQGGANVNHQDIWGCAPILVATQKGDVDAIELLMEHGADLNLKDHDDCCAEQGYRICG